MYPLHLSIVSSTPSTILYPDTYFLDEEIDVLSLVNHDNCHSEKLGIRKKYR